MNQARWSLKWIKRCCFNWTRYKKKQPTSCNVKICSGFKSTKYQWLCMSKCRFVNTALSIMSWEALKHFSVLLRLRRKTNCVASCVKSLVFLGRRKTAQTTANWFVHTEDGCSLAQRYLQSVNHEDGKGDKAKCCDAGVGSENSYRTPYCHMSRIKSKPLSQATKPKRERGGEKKNRVGEQSNGRKKNRERKRERERDVKGGFR